MNSTVAYLPLYRRIWYNWLIFFYSLFSLLSFQFILFSSLSPLFSFTDSLSLINCWSWSVIANLSPVAFCIVIADLSGHCHCHCRSESTWASTLRWDRNRSWGEIGVFVPIVGIDVKVRWDLDHGLPMLVGFDCRCKWIHGFGLAVLVVSWVWAASANGLWLCFLGLSWCVFWI